MKKSRAVSGDTARFRLQAKEKKIPHPSSITYEGVFNDHWFLSKDEKSTKLMEAVGGFTVTTDIPTGGPTKKTLACFLKSTLDGKPRTLPLNLIIALDVSGSMGDTLVEPKTEEDLFTLPAKLAIAQKAISTLLELLKPDDRFALVTFNEKATVVQELKHMGKLDAKEIKGKVDKISAGGGTKLNVAVTECNKIVDTIRESLDPGAEETRLVFITDMRDTTEDPTGAERKNLLNQVKENAERFIFTTVLGVGIDFDTSLTNELIKVRGANYMSVFTEEEFLESLSKKFSFNFFPFAFDLQLRVTLGGSEYKLGKVYGSPFATATTDKTAEAWTPKSHYHYPPYFKETVRTLLLVVQRIRAKKPPLPLVVLGHILSFIAPPVCNLAEINTCFPSEVKDNHIYGGAILIDIEKRDNVVISTTSPEKISLKLRVTYKDRSGRNQADETYLRFEGLKTNFSLTGSDAPFTESDEAKTTSTSTSSGSSGSSSSSSSSSHSHSSSSYSFSSSFSSSGSSSSSGGGGGAHTHTHSSSSSRSHSSSWTSSSSGSRDFFSDVQTKKALYLQRYVEHTLEFLHGHHDKDEEKKTSGAKNLRELLAYLANGSEAQALADHDDFAATLKNLKKFVGDFCTDPAASVPRRRLVMGLGRS